MTHTLSDTSVQPKQLGDKITGYCLDSYCVFLLSKTIFFVTHFSALILFIQK